MPLRTVGATRYVTPLHEGGSLPAIVEGDDDGMYVLKFRGAGQGPKVLIAELIAGEIARALGLPVPELVLMELDADLARTEPDPEIQDLLRASAGLNIALDYLPGSVMFDPVAITPDAQLASEIVWFDAFVSNVDRTARNTNLLVWHRRIRLIDHGAALYFHHAWGSDYLQRSRDAFARIKDHVLLRYADSMPSTDERLSARLTASLIRDIVAQVPDAWFGHEPLFASTHEHREAYVEYLLRRLESPHPFVEEAVRARSLLV
ncbi:MAG TPA: HipA family kinase [Steroidobacteraceae bacterium]|nr:HipA family kinase [Steroidobacteraceae bacterium]